MKHIALISAATALTSTAIAGPGLTLYNEGVAVIREELPLKLTDGLSSHSFGGATAQVRPDSVVLRDPAGNTEFSILEQSYRNDPISQARLLDLFEGKQITFQKTSVDGNTKLLSGEIIRSGYFPNGRHQSPIIKVDNRLQFSLPGEPLFPALGDDTILQPTLSWKIASQAATEVNAQLSYLSGGFSWKASYNVIAPEKGNTASINGWVTLNNTSGATFSDAKIKLVAGEVNVTPNTDPFAEKMESRAFSAQTLADSEVTEKSFDDFHLYTLPRPLTLRDQETKQVEFLGSDSVQTRKRYIYAPASSFRFYGNRNYGRIQQQFPKEIATFWEFKNSKENGLGVPFPAGTMRFYRSDDADGNLEFIGENHITHTPKNELITVETGTAFDLIGERKIMDFKADRDRWARESFSITLKNRSESEKTITVREPLWRWQNWEVEKPSHPFEKIDAYTIEFQITVPADGEETVTYTAHYFDR